MNWSSLHPRTAAGPAATLVAWIYVYLMVMLGAWLFIATIATGWSPVVITTGSMQPSLSPGDVILVDTDLTEPVAQNSVITFTAPNDPDTRITHRVHSTDELNGLYITKGDANPSIDTDPVPIESVQGAGRLVVPIIGLPVVWAQEGNAVALLGWGVLSIAALITAGANLQSRRRKKAEEGHRDRGSALAQKAVRRVRILVAAMIVAQFVIDPDRFEISDLNIARWHVLLASVTALLAVNALSLWASKRQDSAQIARWTVVELVLDSAGAIALTTATGTSGIGWVLFALPVIEAAARFNLAGALMHWMAMTSAALASRIWVLNNTEGGTDLVSQLEGMLDQLSVLLLVIIPGAQLLEQLTLDSRTQRREAKAAVEHGRRLKHVAKVGHEISRLGDAPFKTIAQAVVELGFDEVDVVSRNGATWKVLAIGTSTIADRDDPDSVLALPQPGLAGSGLRDEELQQREVFIDRRDENADDRASIIASPFETLIRITVSERSGLLVAVRAAVHKDVVLELGTIESLRLLCGQATVALQNEQLVGELRFMHGRLEHQAHHDSLTGLPNRLFFMDRLSDALASEQPHLEVLFLDLDGFKPINDTYGHEAGDEVLREVSKRLLLAVGPNGLVGRMGGDEFTILLNDTTTTGTSDVVAARILGSLSEPFDLLGRDARVGASIGAAAAAPGIDQVELLRRADTAMYSAKSSGGATPFVAYSDRLDTDERQRQAIGEALADALRDDELHVAYQPMVDTDTGEVAAVEALLRWDSKLFGPVRPDKIIEAAENAGLVEALNRWIFNRSVSEAAALGLPRHIPLTINASPRELESPFLVFHIRQALELSGLDPSQIIIEMSERIVTSETSYAANLQLLADLGVRLALDDFGEGRTSLGHLRGLPIHLLKLDRRLVQQVATSKADRIILDSVTSLAHELGFQVVAEGIETAEQVETVRRAGVDLLQGFLLYRPMSMAQVIELVDRQTASAPPKRVPNQPTDAEFAAEVIRVLRNEVSQ